MKTEKLLYNKIILWLVVFVSMLSLFCTHSMAYVSLNGIEYVRALSEENGDDFVILEILPQALNGSIGFYIENEEPIQSYVTSEEDLRSRIVQLTAAGLYAQNGSAPLSPQQYILPWQANENSLLVFVPLQSTTVKGTMAVAENMGEFKLKTDTLSNSSNNILDFDEDVASAIEQNSTTNYAENAEFIYVGSGGDFNLIETNTESEVTIYYDKAAITTGYINNNWFNLNVLNDEKSAVNVEVISMTPSMLDINSENPNSLNKIIEKADMIVLSAGFDTFANTSMHSNYSANDISSSQAELIKNYVLPQNGEKGLPFIFDARIAGVSNTQIARLVNEIANGKDMTYGFVFENIYCFAPTLSLNNKRPQLATKDFNQQYESALFNYSGTVNANSFNYNSAYPFYSVISEIRFENEWRKQLTNGETAPENYYIPEVVTMATSIRHIINYSYEQNKKPTVIITDENGNSQNSLLLPTLYNSSELSGTVLSGQNLKLGFYLTDLNTHKDIVVVQLFYESKNGNYYFDNIAGEIKKIAEGINAGSTQKFSVVQMPQSIIDILQDFASTNTPINNEFFTFNIENEIINALAIENQNDIQLYLQANVKTGYRNYNALSPVFTLKKLGLLPLG